MSLKKKGTPKKIEVIDDLEAFQKLVNRALDEEILFVKEEKKKDKSKS